MSLMKKVINGEMYDVISERDYFNNPSLYSQSSVPNLAIFLFFTIVVDIYSPIIIITVIKIKYFYSIIFIKFFI